MKVIIFFQAEHLIFYWPCSFQVELFFCFFSLFYYFSFFFFFSALNQNPIFVISFWFSFSIWFRQQQKINSALHSRAPHSHFYWITLLYTKTKHKTREREREKRINCRFKFCLFWFYFCRFVIFLSIFFSFAYVCLRIL